jgi:hypothetical protein
MPLSLMPDNLAKLLTPADAANVIAWLPTDPAFAAGRQSRLHSVIDRWSGQAEFESSDVGNRTRELVLRRRSVFSRIAGLSSSFAKIQVWANIVIALRLENRWR